MVLKVKHKKREREQKNKGDSALYSDQILYKEINKSYVIKKIAFEEGLLRKIKTRIKNEKKIKTIGDKVFSLYIVIQDKKGKENSLKCKKKKK